MSIDTNEDTQAGYYAGGFRRTFGGVPCKVFSRRTTDGRYVAAKDSPRYDPLYDGTNGISRLQKDPAVIDAARALLAKPVRKPRKAAAKAVEHMQAAAVPSGPSHDVAALLDRLAALEATTAAAVAHAADMECLALSYEADATALAARLDRARAAAVTRNPLPHAPPPHVAFSVLSVARSNTSRRAPAAALTR